jgi:hypothetical protein
MWPADVPRPSDQLADLLRGKLAWDEAPEAIRSWAALPIHQAAAQIVAAPDKGARRNMLGRIPASVRPHVETEVKRLWERRKVTQ